MSDNLQWWKEFAHKYRGLWVAVYDGKLIATDKERPVLIGKVSKIRHNENMLITYISAEDYIKRFYR